MKTFDEYINFKERASYDVGDSLLGNVSLSDDQEAAFKLASTAFISIAKKSPGKMAAFLNQNADAAGINPPPGGFRDSDFMRNLRPALNKSQRVISKGLADVNPDDVKDGADVIATNSSDSFHNPIG